MSELLTDRDWWAAARYPSADEDWGPPSGRHAYDEDAALTPIFHALTRGGWRERQHEPAVDPVDAFRRDPLTAPIPVQAPVSASTRWRRERRETTGRHHLPREAPRRRW